MEWGRNEDNALRIIFLQELQNVLDVLVSMQGLIFF
jgi:hypothetical protein